jgi:hypothetical protein
MYIAGSQLSAFDLLEHYCTAGAAAAKISFSMKNLRFSQTRNCMHAVLLDLLANERHS